MEYTLSTDALQSTSHCKASVLVIKWFYIRKGGNKICLQH